MELLEIKSKFEKVISRETVTPLDMDRHLILLMKEMENQFHIPLFPNKKFKFEHKDVFDLYSQIYAYRSQLYKKDQKRL